MPGCMVVGSGRTERNFSVENAAAIGCQEIGSLFQPKPATPVMDFRI